jgi:uncharacterized protein (TIGR01777 family)
MEDGQTKVLITGGTGLVGQRLTEMLSNNGYRVAHVSRRKRKSAEVETFEWDVDNGTLEDGALEGVDHIVHLAGAGVADKRWTESRKREIYNSRINSTNLLYNQLREQSNHVKSLISASAVGYYGDGGDKLLTEDSPPANDFLGQTCIDWENAALQVEELDKRVAILRTGIVLSAQGGALKEIERPVKLGVPSHLGDGRQYYPWLHLDDLCLMYVHAIENENLKGIYNAVGPYAVRNKEMVLTIADILARPKFSIPAPKIALKLALGEMAAMVLFSQNVSSAKIQETGFSFRYTTLEDALKNIYGKE